jgi:hypothetical protein
MDTSKSRIVAMAILSVFLYGCAGSTSRHKMVEHHQPGDEALSCTGIETEIEKTQAIIDGVNQDKEDIDTADVVDGILYFPFNLIAKDRNYSLSLKTSDARLERLNELREEKNCTAETEKEPVY